MRALRLPAPGGGHSATLWCLYVGGVVAEMLIAQYQVVDQGIFELVQKA